ncbi:MAG: 3-oxoacyl-ACP synthase [Actinobacteria bacterium]|nr:3-oxoacyl-ACP synthase [Actinomycetota bacterium]
MRTRIESIGLYLPEREVTTSELISGMKTKPAFNLERITGIKARRFRSEDESTFTMAINAAENCLSHSRYEPEDIDLVISASISRLKEGTTALYEPPLSLLYKKRLGAFQAENFDINNACAGMTNGIRILDAMIKAGQVKTGMVVSGECISPIAETAVKEISDPIDDQFSALTVGDSGAAFIMDGGGSAEEGIDFVETTTVSKYSHLCIGQPSDKNAGYAMYTKTKEMLSPETLSVIPRFIEEVFEKHGKPFEASAYDYIITHQVSVRRCKAYMNAIKEYFNADPPENLLVVDDLGNTASTSIFVSLYTHLENKRLKKGNRLLLISTASGINYGLVSMTLGDLEV